MRNNAFSRLKIINSLAAAGRVQRRFPATQLQVRAKPSITCLSRNDMKRSYDELSMAKLKESWKRSYNRKRDQFVKLQTLTDQYSAWLNLQSDADELYKSIIMVEHEHPHEVIMSEIALYHLMEQESYLRKKLTCHQPDVTRIEGRPTQARDKQFGKLISMKLRLLENRLKIDTEKLRIVVKGVERELNILRGLSSWGCPRFLLEIYHYLIDLLKRFCQLYEDTKVATKIAGVLEQRDLEEKMDRISKNRQLIYNLLNSRKVHTRLEYEEEEANKRASRRLMKASEEEVLDVFVEPIYDARAWEEAVEEVRVRKISRGGMFNKQMPLPVNIKKYAMKNHHDRWLS